jgi:phosphoserine phosphatase
MTEVPGWLDEKEDETEDETENENHGDWVITIAHRRSVEHALGRVYDRIKEQGLELDLIHALSHVTPDGFIRTPESLGGYSCCEVFFHGRRFDDGRNVEAAMRAELRAMADDAEADLVLESKAEHGRAMRLFCFDMDSTLIQGETIDELARMAGVGDQVVAITAAAMRGEFEFQESFRRRVALLKGLPEARVLEAIDRLPLMEGAERLFRTLKARGAKTAIFSGGFTFFGDHLKKKLGVDHVFANHLHVQDGAVTGEVLGGIVDGARKAELLVEIAGREGIPLEQVCAVGDGANDLPMLRLAGMGVAFHAKPVVRAEARYAMTHVGLDGLLYLLGIPDREWA